MGDQEILRGGNRYVENGKIVRAHHVEDWEGPFSQLSAK